MEKSEIYPLGNMRIYYIPLAIGIALILYLSWQPSYDFRHLWFIPGWLSEWTDKHENGNIRTAVPFLFMGLVSGFLPIRRANPLYRWSIRWLILVGVVTMAEAGQLFIPSRYPSFEDIGWGALGALIGVVGAITFETVLKQFRK